MNTKVYNTIFNFYKATIKRYYNEAEEERLLNLFLLLSGVVNRESKERSMVIDAIRRVDSVGIGSYVESKNYVLFLNYMDEPEHIVTAAKAIANAFVYMDGVTYLSAEEWIDALKKGAPTNEVCALELALVLYAKGDAVESLKLVERLIKRVTSLEAIKYAACIAFLDGSVEQALYYYNVYKEICAKSVCLKVPEYITNIYEDIESGLSANVVESARERASEFISSLTQSRIGFC